MLHFSDRAKERDEGATCIVLRSSRNGRKDFRTLWLISMETHAEKFSVATILNSHECASTQCAITLCRSTGSSDRKNYAGRCWKTKMKKTLRFPIARLWNHRWKRHARDSTCSSLIQTRTHTHTIRLCCQFEYITMKLSAIYLFVPHLIANGGWKRFTKQMCAQFANCFFIHNPKNNKTLRVRALRSRAVSRTIARTSIHWPT